MKSKDCGLKMDIIDFRICYRNSLTLIDLNVPVVLKIHCFVVQCVVVSVKHGFFIDHETRFLFVVDTVTPVNALLDLTTLLTELSVTVPDRFQKTVQIDDTIVVLGFLVVQEIDLGSAFKNNYGIQHLFQDMMKLNHIGVDVQNSGKILGFDLSTLSIP